MVEFSGVLASQRKEEIHHEIEMQQELGEEGLLEEDQYLMEVNLEYLENASGEKRVGSWRPRLQGKLVCSGRNG